MSRYFLEFSNFLHFIRFFLILVPEMLQNSLFSSNFLPSIAFTNSKIPGGAAHNGLPSGYSNQKPCMSQRNFSASVRP